ncbi:MAG: M1 family metallopeptidase [Acidobacteria bacterium]|nr:M1 family metallopeptidase [Acidobacteriota bacterium]
MITRRATMVPVAACLVACWLAVAGTASAQSETAPPSLEELDPLVERIETAVRAGDPDAFLALVADGADPDATRTLANRMFLRTVDAAAVRSRLLRPVEGDSETETDGSDSEPERYELTVEVFTEQGMAGLLRTWRIEVIRAPGAHRALDDTPPDGAASDDARAAPVAWRIVALEEVDAISGLVHLALRPDLAYNAAGLVVSGEDMTLRMTNGFAFVAETQAGEVTALMLLGDGVLTFSPQPEAERGQVRILSGRDALEAELSAAYVRLNPLTFASRVSYPALVAGAARQGDFERAQELFSEFVPLSFGIDLSDLSDRTWSLTPSAGDIVSEIVTERYGTLTFAQSMGQPEDVSLYERETQTIIALYPSAEKRATRDRYFSEDDTQEYDVRDYSITASFEPQGVRRASLSARPVLVGCFIRGRTRLAVRITGSNVASLTLRLADELDIHSIVSDQLGPLLFFRVPERDNVVVSLPAGSPPVGTEFVLDVRYSGVLRAQELEENWLGRQQIFVDNISPFGISAPRYIYSNNSYWYPQASVSDFATATMDLSVPADYAVVASGVPEEGGPSEAAAAATEDAGDGWRSTRFVTLQPARYLSAVISRFASPDPPPGGDDAIAPRDVPARLAADAPAVDVAGKRRGVSYDGVRLAVVSNQRTRGRIDDFYAEAEAILSYYGSIIGEMPYPTFTLLLTDALLPGGHSPAYFAVLNQPLPRAVGNILSWRTDPVAFSGYPSFFVAHELAHQWWGQAVGWKNYHEHWLSEGLAQYFAALYAEHTLGAEAFEDVIAQMHRWSLRHSDQGPVYLGNRLGRIEDEPRVFRALVYNKAALVLHMLRRTIGDDAFFAGLRRFYYEMRFQKAGTDDLIRAFEAESGRPLEAFFERWIHEDDLPDLTFSYRTEAGAGGENEVVLRFEQRGKLFEFPVSVTLQYRGAPDEILVAHVAGEVTELRRPLRGDLRNVEVNDDRAALVDID